MSRSNPRETILIKEIKAGIHPVSILDASLQKNVAISGETGLKITFKNIDNKIFEKIFWLGGDRHVEFLKMCLAANINIESRTFRKEAKGKELWIYINESYDIIGEEIVMGKKGPLVNYYIFDYHPIDGGKKPVLKGDPADNNGRASGKFLNYVSVAPSLTYRASNEDDCFPIEESRIEGIINVSDERMNPMSEEPIIFGEK